MGSSLSSSSQAIDNSVRSSVHSLANNFVFCPPPSTGLPYPNGVKPVMVSSKNGNYIETVICNYNEDKVDIVVIFSHGNASSNEYMAQYFMELSRSLNICVVGYDYQGYGNSEGVPSEQNCCEDLESVVEFVRTDSYFNNVAENAIFLIGQSLGTGVTMDYVSKHYWENPIILISPYKSIFTVVFDEESSFMTTSGRYDMFTTQKKTSGIKCPIKIFHGMNDGVISYEHSKKLFEVLPNKKFRPTFIPNCGHNDILNRINAFDLNQVIR